MYSLTLSFDRGCTAVIKTPWYVINKDGSVSFEGCPYCWPNTYNVKWEIE